MKHPIYQGVVGAIITAVAAVIGALIGNSGAVSDYLPGAPLETRTVTVAAAPAPTVTATATTTVSASAEPTFVETNGGLDIPAVFLTDVESRPDDILAETGFVARSNTTIDGKVSDAAWTGSMSSSNTQRRVLVGINLNQAYSRFVARLGVAGTSRPAQGKIEVVGDGRVLFSKSVSLQRSFDVSLGVDSIQRLEIVIYPPTDSVIQYAVGDPALFT